MARLTHKIERLKSVIICDNLWTKNSVEKKAMNLRKQAVTTKCRGEFLCGAKSRDFEKAVDFRALKICDNPIKNYICDNLWMKIICG